MYIILLEKSDKKYRYLCIYFLDSVVLMFYYFMVHELKHTNHFLMQYFEQTGSD